MRDDLLMLQADGTTKYGNFNSAGVEVGQTPRSRALYARVDYHDAYADAAGGTASFKLQESDDNSAFTDLSSSSETIAFTVAATKKNGIIWIPFNTEKRYLRLALTIAEATGPHITYGCGIVLSKF